MKRQREYPSSEEDEPAQDPIPTTIDSLPLELKQKIEANREAARQKLRDKAPQPHVRSLQDGIALVQNFLSQEEQLLLLKDIESCKKHYKPTQARNPNSNFTKIIALDFLKKPELIPHSFNEFSAAAMKHASSKDPTIPSAYQPNYCTSFVYGPDGKLMGHCDKVTGWVCLISLGSTCLFHIKGQKMKAAETLEFKSGECLIFDGASDLKVFHGITLVCPNTCPDYFPETYHDKRVSVQFRQTLKNDNPVRYRKKY